MSQAAGHAAHDLKTSGHGGGSAHGPHHGPMYYVKIWALLLVLLVISILGPELGNKILTLITAFGIAVVKAGIVCAYFMHLNIEKRYIWYMLYSMLLMVGLFFAGVATDINRPQGRNWINKAAQTHIEEHLEPKAGEGGATQPHN